MVGLENLVRTDERELELKCHSGKAVAKVGDTFGRLDTAEMWTIVGFGKRRHETIVLCRPDGAMPSWARKFQEDDGAVAFCDDTIAAYLLEKEDGRDRDARGYLVVHRDR